MSESGLSSCRAAHRGTLAAMIVLPSGAFARVRYRLLLPWRFLPGVSTSIVPILEQERPDLLVVGQCVTTGGVTSS